MSTDLQGYLCIDSNTTVAQIDAMLLDSDQHSGIVDVSFGNFDANGNFVPPNASQEVMAEIEKDAKLRGIELKISIGGAAGGVILPSATDLNYTTYMTNAGITLAAFMQANGMTGVDLDIENSNPAKAQIDLIHSLREHIGSEASITYTVEGTVPDSMNYKEVIQTCLKDGSITAVNLMAYDTFWSSYVFTDDIAKLKSWGVDSEHLILGAFPEAGGKEGGNTIEQIQAMAKYAKDNGIKMSFWDINNDFNGETALPKDAGELAIWDILHPKKN